MSTKKRGLTDKEVELEIERLEGSDLVKLARKELNIQYKRRQRLYQLRNFEKRGKELQGLGITMEMLNKIADELE